MSRTNSCRSRFCCINLRNFSDNLVVSCAHVQLHVRNLKETTNFDVILALSSRFGGNDAATLLCLREDEMRKAGRR
jgi:hypothetical protein